ncbi:calcium-binding protein [Argonema antarcticum]|uniref:calcium-binding protein n=1 Tax=Argonema antarcticum TaxID=2942763 RepID=UPI002011447B|nr:hypothetical protein [Argonema antarcticum]MCL1475277.1 hypothetical protein [Argonema antarcticum A004/B2]
MATIFGTTANDTLTGTPEPDFISALAGNDILIAIAQWCLRRCEVFLSYQPQKAEGATTIEKR